jgi:hypothetical protein
MPYSKTSFSDSDSDNSDSDNSDSDNSDSDHHRNDHHHNHHNHHNNDSHSNGATAYILPAILFIVLCVTVYLGFYGNKALGIPRFLRSSVPSNTDDLSLSGSQHLLTSSDNDAKDNASTNTKLTTTRGLLTMTKGMLDAANTKVAAYKDKANISFAGRVMFFPIGFDPGSSKAVATAMVGGLSNLAKVQSVDIDYGATGHFIPGPCVNELNNLNIKTNADLGKSGYVILRAGNQSDPLVDMYVIVKHESLAQLKQWIRTQTENKHPIPTTELSKKVVFRGLKTMLYPIIGTVPSMYKSPGINWYRCCTDISTGSYSAGLFDGLAAKLQTQVTNIRVSVINGHTNSAGQPVDTQYAYNVYAWGGYELWRKLNSGATTFTQDRTISHGQAGVFASVLSHR